MVRTTYQLFSLEMDAAQFTNVTLKFDESFSECDEFVCTGTITVNFDDNIGHLCKPRMSMYLHYSNIWEILDWFQLCCMKSKQRVTERILSLP